MDLFTRNALQDLLTSNEPPAVSVYLPTLRTGREIQQNTIRWKNVLKRAEDHLRQTGVSGSDINHLLAEPRRIASDTDWWEHQSDGLAVFLSPQRFDRYRLPLSFDEFVGVRSRFYVKPVLPLFEGDGEFYILAISQNAIRLLKASRYSATELDPRGLPKNLRDALNIDEYVDSLQYHSTERGRLGRQWGIFHGHGGSDMDVEKKDEILQYFYLVNKALNEFVPDQRTPLVFAGVDYLFPIFREASSYRRLVEQPVTGNPDELSPAELQRKAWSVIEPVFSADRSLILNRYGTAQADGLASSDLSTVLGSARNRRVDTLLVARSAKLWGKMDATASSPQVTQLAQNAPGAEDLVNLAVEETLLGDGAVYTFEPDDVPDRAPLAAIFRYPA